ncbi:MAG: sigma-54-dependent transcriptional regulator [Rhodothermales bacterium]
MAHTNGTNQRPAQILIVDDDSLLRRSLRDILEFKGYAVLEATDGKSALEQLAHEAVDLMLLDLEMPRVHGMDVLRDTVDKHPQVPVIIISGKGTIRIAVEATKLGAYDFLEKPVKAERTLLTVRRALEKAALQIQRDCLLDEARARYRMVGSSRSMQRIYRLIDKAAASRSRVLIMGASGTGKELVARAIHHNSDRAAGPFIAVNCAAIPETLIESELFGYEKGAFTGAKFAHQGKFEQAHGGTLFLDEVGDMSLMTQAKVLRVLEEERIEPIGGKASLQLDVRVVAATNKDLRAEIEEGNFREDLFYRLHIITLHLPLLRDRREDIPALVQHFVHVYSHENGLPRKTLAKGTLSVLVDHDWPGNIRQLRNVAERLVVLSDGQTITPNDARHALQLRTTDDEPPHQQHLIKAREQFEREHILKTLITHDWKIQASAHTLGIDRSYLWKKMQRYGITQPN